MEKEEGRGKRGGRELTHDCRAIGCNCCCGSGPEETGACAGNPRSGIGRDEGWETEFFESPSVGVHGAHYGGR